MSYTEVNMSPRDRAFELVDAGLVDKETMLMCCLQYMSYDDIEDMLNINSLEEGAYDE